jgi:hypothetical protein
VLAADAGLENAPDHGLPFFLRSHVEYGE